GYLDVEVHPDYTRNRWIYLAYSEDQPGYVPPPPSNAAPTDGRGGRGGQRTRLTLSKRVTTTGGPSPPSPARQGSHCRFQAWTTRRCTTRRRLRQRASPSIRATSIQPGKTRACLSAACLAKRFADSRSKATPSSVRR